MPDDAPTLGAALVAARESSGLSVEQVSAATRIRATLVRDLEADRFASSGGTVYARGHVKSIAAALRTDAAPLLALFDQAQGSTTEPLLEQPAASGPVTTTLGSSAFAASAAASLSPERRGPRWGLALSGAAAALVAITAVGYAQQGSGSGADQADLAGAGTPSPTPAATQPAGAAPTEEPVLTAAAPPPTGAQLRLRVIGSPSWVSVSSPSSTLFEGVLGDGVFKDFNDATRLKVVVGNAQSVNLNCGGTDSGPAGAAGAVRRFECTAAGLKPL